MRSPIKRSHQHKVKSNGRIVRQQPKNRIVKRKVKISFVKLNQPTASEMEAKNLELFASKSDEEMDAICKHFGFSPEEFGIEQPPAEKPVRNWIRFQENAGSYIR